MPLVSVVMPVRDAERFVGLAVRSILAQTLGDLELVVVDDGSSDQSLVEVERVADNRVRVVQSAGHGVSAARNAGLRGGDSDFVALMDADDTSHPERLARQVAELRGRRPKHHAIGSSYRAIDEHGAEILIARHLTAHDAIAVAAYSFNPVCGASLLIARDRIEAVGGYGSSDLAEDYDLVCRLLRSGALVGNLPEPLLDYRWHARNTSRTRRAAMDAALAAVREQHWKLSPPNPSLRAVIRARGRPERLHASAALQLAAGLHRRRRYLGAAKVVIGAIVSNPRGVAALRGRSID